jgi:hypothetical protein
MYLAVGKIISRTTRFFVVKAAWMKQRGNVIVDHPASLLLCRLFSNHEEYRIHFIQEIHLSPKPMCLSISNIALYSTLSNDFSKSSLTMPISLLDLWHRWI